MSVFSFGVPEQPEPRPEIEQVVVTDRDDNEVVVNAEQKSYSIALNLAGKQAALKALEEANDVKVKRLDELRIAKKALQDQMDLITTEIHDIDLNMYDYRSAKRALSNEIFELRRLLAQALQAEINEERLAENRIAFNKKMGQYAYADKIMEHQKDGAFILATNMRTILGDKRGAGKTLTAIASWDMNQSQRILVIVPDDVVSNFVNEIHYWAPHRNVLQLGKLPRDQRQVALMVAKQSEQFVIVMNYSSWRKDKTLIPDLINLRFDTIVMDEAHEMKNTSTSAYRGVREITLAENCCPRCSGEVERKATEDKWDSYLNCLACAWDSLSDPDWEFGDRCSIKMVTPMSGTVILNKPQDLFALLSLVDPQNFRQVKDFLRVYCMQDWYTSKWVFRPGGLDSLKVKLSGRYIAREGVKTPGQTIYSHDLTIDPALYPGQWKVITQLSKHAQILLESGKKMTPLATIALITRKRQANVWPAGIQLKDEDGNIIFNVGEEVQESIKLDKCIGMEDGEWAGLIPEFTEDGDKELGSRVVVFSQFKGPLAELERRCTLAGISVVRFDGDTPQNVRDEAKLDFDRRYCDAEGYNNGEGYKWQVLLANYKTGGVGLNFTAATEMIELDQEWNPGKEDQARGRIDRMGQTEETNVHVINIERTIDAWMRELNAQKADVINGFNEATEPLNNALLDAMKNGDIL